MRKHLVVVGVAASALLLAGGVAATSAGAEENPDIPGLPFSWSGLPGWSGFGSDDSDYDDTGDDVSDADDDAAAAEEPDDVYEEPEEPTQDDSDMSDQDGDDQDEEPPAQRNPVQHNQPQRNQAQHNQAQHNQAQHNRAQTQRNQDQAQQNQGQRSQAQTRRNQAPAVNHAIAARRPVTAADVSASPSAPVQLRVLELINQNRRRGGCESVSLDGRLIDAANEHASDMARRRYFAHESPNGDGAGERVREAGYRWKRYGENIARGADSPYEVVDGWMHSPSHRKNILDCSLHEMGIGLALSRAGTTYWVQDFATPLR